MTKKEFLKLYYLEFSINERDEKLIVITTRIKRSDKNKLDSVSTIHSISKMSMAIADSQTMISMNSLDWGKIIDFTKRLQIDYFAQNIPIEDYYVLDKLNNPDISEFYI